MAQSAQPHSRQCRIELAASAALPKPAVVLGVPIAQMPLEQLLDVAFERIAARQKTLFTTANAHSVVVAQHLPAFADHFREADAVLPDGISAVWGARACGGSISRRVCGPDFFAAFLVRAAAAHRSVFFLGTTEQTLLRLSGVCRRRWPSLRIAGTLSPPFGALGPETNRRMVDSVNRARPDALFVSMTAPKQELWLSAHRRELRVPFTMGVGAAFDFVAGTRARAPALVGSLGLEWLYRLAHEPLRLWRRNLDSLVYVSMLARSVGRARIAAALH